MTQNSIATTSEVVPVDAATLVLVDQSGLAPRFLMGRRSPTLAFMPNKFVFPGGRVDSSDQTSQSANEFSAAVCAKLQFGMIGQPSSLRARALGIAAIREAREETGVVLGQIAHPPLAALQFFARAITPPDRPRRYDTRFFMADAALATQTVLIGDGELTEIAWVTLAEMHELDLPNITRLIIEDIANMMTTDFSHAGPVPFYQNKSGRTERGLL